MINHKYMYNTKRKRGCKSQGGCTANGASRPTGDRFNNKGSLQWAKDFLAHYEGGIEAHPELVDSRDYWCAQYFVTMDKLFGVQAKLNKANKEVKMLRSCLRYSDGKLINVRLKVAELYESLGVSVGDDFDGLDELDL